MINATDYALRRGSELNAVWSEVGQDLVRGALVFARLVVLAAGCLTLLAGGTLLASGDARGRLIERAIEIATTFPAGALGAGSETAAEQSTPSTEAASANGGTAATSLDPQQKRVAQYLARRYRVADEAVRMIVASAYETGQALGLDPLLILAVTAVESSMNPFAESPMGAQGLMQVMTRVHADKFEAHGGDFAALNPIANLKVGSMILKDLVRRGGSVERGLQLYVGAGNQPDDGGYASRVLAEQRRLSIAAGGRIERALAAARTPVLGGVKPVKTEANVAQSAQPPAAAPASAPDSRRIDPT